MVSSTRQNTSEGELMGFLDEMLITEKTVKAEFRNLTTAFVDGTVTEDYSTNPDLTVNKCLFWVGRSADAVVSEKIRAEVEGVIVFNYSDYTTTVNENAKITIGSTDYSVIFIENVANQNEIIQIPVKRFS